MPKVFIIDGDNFSDYQGFCREFSTVVLSGKYEWRGNLDAFNDILFGGFGDLDDGEEYTLEWKNSQKSRADLGYKETVKKLRSDTGNSSLANKSWLARIEDAENNRGNTLFEQIVEIIKDNHNITLVLE